MKELADLISSIAFMLWPVIAAAVILMLRPALISLVTSAKSRKFTIKIGGQELTMEEASEQQQSLIADLQVQIIELKKRLQLDAVAPNTAAVRERMSVSGGKAAVLWVDDEPKNNSYFVQQLAEGGVPVDLALSTEEGLRLFDQKRYTLVISDLGRREGSSYNSQAGLDLLKRIRQKDNEVPFLIYASSRGVQENQEQALALGATGITSSSTDLAGMLRSAFGRGAGLTKP